MKFSNLWLVCNKFYSSFFWLNEKHQRQTFSAEICILGENTAQYNSSLQCSKYYAAAATITTVAVATTTATATATTTITNTIFDFCLTRQFFRSLLVM